MHNVNSFTADVQASLSDNGKEIYQVSSISQQDIKGDASSSSFTINNGSVSKKVDLFNNDQQEIVKSSDDESYYVKQDNEGKDQGREHNEEEQSPQMQKDIEAYLMH